MGLVQAYILLVSLVLSVTDLIMAYQGQNVFNQVNSLKGI